MRLTITDKLTARTANDGQAVPFAVKVYTDDAEPWVLVVPTTLRYRLDNLDTGYILVDWTSVTPDDESTITISGAINTLSTCRPRTHLQLTVEADHALSTNAVETRDYWVRNLAGVS